MVLGGRSQEWGREASTIFETDWSRHLHLQSVRSTYLLQCSLIYSLRTKQGICLRAMVPNSRIACCTVASPTPCRKIEVEIPVLSALKRRVVLYWAWYWTRKPDYNGRRVGARGGSSTCLNANQGHTLWLMSHLSTSTIMAMWGLRIICKHA